MKSFVLSLLVGVGLATVGAVTLARVLLPESTWEQSAPSGGTASRSMRAGGRTADDSGSASGQYSFSQHDAVEVVAARLGASPAADAKRRELRSGAQVEYHSPGHWTVKLNQASWTAHGVGAPYAEPDNQAAQLYEQQSTAP